jgi:hypothetical protein
MRDSSKLYLIESAGPGPWSARWIAEPACLGGHDGRARLITAARLPG